MIDVRVQSGDFDCGRQMERLRELGRGAASSVLGSIEVEDEVAEVLVEHYSGMAKAELQRIAEEAQERWPVAGIILIHRYGRFAPGDRILFVGAACSDRKAAMEACAFLAEAIDARAPFWRKDMLSGGGSRWTESLSVKQLSA